MKKILIFVAVAFFAAMTCGFVSCQRSLDKEGIAQQVTERIKEMEKIGDADNQADSLLSQRLLAATNEGLNMQLGQFFAFRWFAQVSDVCTFDTLMHYFPGDEIKSQHYIKLDSVKVIDATHADASMVYHDGECYDFHYTLNMLLEDGKWMIDNVQWLDVNHDDKGNSVPIDEYTRLKEYLDETRQFIAELSAEDLAHSLSFYGFPPENNENAYGIQEWIRDYPKQAQYQYNTIKNAWAEFKKSPNYDPKYDARIDSTLNAIIATSEKYNYPLEK